MEGGIGMRDIVFIFIEKNIMYKAAFYMYFIRDF